MGVSPNETTTPISYKKLHTAARFAHPQTWKEYPLYPHRYSLAAMNINRTCRESCNDHE